MKKFITILALFTAMPAFLFSIAHVFAHNPSSSAFLRNETTPLCNQKDGIIVLVNYASWCSICQAHGARIDQLLLSKVESSEKFNVVRNDMSTDVTRQNSMKGWEKMDISEVAKKNVHTGMLYFIDPATKKVVDEISFKKDDADILKIVEKYAH
jgi:thiol-disulfide isomerase/thioredoxin